MRRRDDRPAERARRRGRRPFGQEERDLAFGDLFGFDTSPAAAGDVGLQTARLRVDSSGPSKVIRMTTRSAARGVRSVPVCIHRGASSQPRRTLTSVPDLVHRRTLDAFREWCSDMSVIRQIERTFENEGFDPAPDREGHDWYRPGMRRGTFDRYAASVNWSDPADVGRALNAFEEMMSWGEGGEHLRRHLQRDGFVVDEDGRVRSSAASVLSDVPLANLKDPAAIMEHLDRIANATDRDPGVAISGAKALIEATTKLVLIELGEQFDEKADVPTLVKQAQKALKLHPEDLAPTAAGVEITKRILSNLSQMAIGVAELRNQYGPDHGRTTRVIGLGPRHAHLAVGCAATYCRMLLETLDARRS